MNGDCHRKTFISQAPTPNRCPNCGRVGCRHYREEHLISRKAVIHGTGLIGASIGLGLKANGWTVVGWDPDPNAAAMALSRDAIDEVLEAPSGGDADLLVLAGPPWATADALAELDANEVGGGGLMTDIASVKASIVSAGSHLPRFVAGHPMAGSAASGANHATAHLFQGASWVLCDDAAAPGALDEMAAIVSSLGANPVVISGADHDRYVAIVSHLPRVIASALLELVGEDANAAKLVAGSFRDLTRVAGSNADWWTDVLGANRDAVVDSIGSLEEVLDAWRTELTASDRQGVSERLARAAETRSHFGAPVAEIRVVLFDRPGEIARVGKALAESHVDLRDIQLRHAEHGGGGILTLSINASETESLRSALAKNDFEIET